MRFLLVSFLLYAQLSFAAEIELKNASISEFVNWVSQHLGKTIVVGTGLESQTTVYATYQTQQQLEDLLEGIIVSAGYNIKITNDFILISKDAIAEQYAEEPELIAKEDGLLNSALNLRDYTPRIQRFYTLQNLSSDYFVSLVRNIYPEANVYDMVNTNTVLVTLREDEFEPIDILYKKMDQPFKQVVIEAIIAEVSEDDINAYGADILLGGQNFFTNNLASEIAQAGAFTSFNLVSPSNLDAFLTMVNSSSTSSILSSPRITVIDRKQGSIHVGQNVPFITGIQPVSQDSGFAPIQTIERQDVGVTLQIIPLILPNNTVELEVYQEVSNVSDSIQASDIITNERNMSSTLILEDGQSIYLGGLKSNNDQETIKRVPGLSAIPILGKVFTSTEKKSVERTLAVILTAHIL